MNSFTQRLVDSGIDPRTHETAGPSARYRAVITSTIVFKDDKGVDHDVLRIAANGSVETLWSTYGERSLKHLVVLADAIRYLAWLEDLTQSKDEAE